MKSTILISGVALLFFAGSQVCGCGSCSQANAQTIQSPAIKSEPKTVTLKVTGMTCAGCANHISASLDKLDGVLKQEVKYPGDIATVKYDPEKTSEKAIIAAIEKTGQYKAEVIQEDGKAGLEDGKKACAPGCTKSCCAKK